MNIKAPVPTLVFFSSGHFGGFRLDTRRGHTFIICRLSPGIAPTRVAQKAGRRSLLGRSHCFLSKQKAEGCLRAEKKLPSQPSFCFRCSSSGQMLDFLLNAR